MQPGPLGGQYRTRDVIAEELLGDAGETEQSGEHRTEVGDRTETATDVEILTGPAAPE